MGDVLYVSGTTARDGDTVHGDGEYEQARIVFAKIRRAIEAAGGTMNDVAKMTILVTNIRNNTEVWLAGREFFTDPFPASSLVEVRALGKPQILVEIEVIAHLASSAA